MVNVPVKRRGIGSRHVGIRKTSVSEHVVKHRNRTTVASKPELTLGSGKSMEGTYLLAMWCPVQSRRESDPGFRTELENLVGADKG